jgi:hypothetical protein
MEGEGAEDENYGYNQVGVPGATGLATFEQYYGQGAAVGAPGHENHYTKQHPQNAHDHFHAGVLVGGKGHEAGYHAERHHDIQRDHFQNGLEADERHSAGYGVEHYGQAHAGKGTKSHFQAGFVAGQEGRDASYHGEKHHVEGVDHFQNGFGAIGGQGIDADHHAERHHAAQNNYSVMPFGSEAYQHLPPAAMHHAHPTKGRGTISTVPLGANGNDFGKSLVPSRLTSKPNENSWRPQLPQGQYGPEVGQLYKRKLTPTRAPNPHFLKPVLKELVDSETENPWLSTAQQSYKHDAAFGGQYLRPSKVEAVIAEKISGTPADIGVGAGVLRKRVAPTPKIGGGGPIILSQKPKLTPGINGSQLNMLPPKPEVASKITGGFQQQYKKNQLATKINRSWGQTQSFPPSRPPI